MPPSPRIAAALAAVAARLGRAGVPFVVAGSTGRALLGAAVRPRDLDVEVPVAAAGAAAAALGIALREDAGGGRRSIRGSRRLAGVEVDLTAGLVVSGPGGVLPPDFAAQHAAARTIALGGLQVRPAPIEEGLVRALVAGEWDGLARLAAGAAAAGEAPPDLAYVSGRLSAAASAAR